MKSTDHRARRSTLRLALAVALLMIGCSGRRAPQVDFRGEPPRPLILVPGVTGTELFDGDQILWGDGPRLLRPRDGAYSMARSLAAEDSGDREGSRIRPGEVMEEVRIFRVIRSPVYGPVLDVLEELGYERERTLFAFGYDWRQDNVESARRLLQKLRDLRAQSGVERLEVDLLCQSNGAHICRYLAKYGDASLDEAEAGRGGLPPEIAVRQIVLIGSANGGSLRILRDLHRGRVYVPLIGRRMLPETPFTFPSLYQDLAVRGPRYFLDERGRSLDVELWDADNWERYGWSIFAPDASERADLRPDLFGDLEDRRSFLRDALRRAERFQALLARDAPGFDVQRYDSIQNVFEPTPRRIVLTDAEELLFVEDVDPVENPALRALLSEPGDGHAGFASQTAISTQERRVLSSVVHVQGSHFRMIHSEKTRLALQRVLRQD